MRGVSQKLSPGVEPSSVEYECRSGQAYNSAFREISGSHIHFCASFVRVVRHN